MTDEREAGAPGAAGEGGAVPEAGAIGAGGTSGADDGGGRADLLDLIDRLSGLLDRSDLAELEVESGGTALVLRTPAALAPPVAMTTVVETGSGSGPAAGGPADAGRAGAERRAAAERPSVKAPLTGIWYASPSPGSAPYLQVGGEVVVGQIIGLIEAMKLFNEIKSDLAGRVVRILVENGQLVKAKQPVVELEPL
jgi:acetyl-CoA carboxylase biotin carboxyl carrier protein